MIQPQIYHIILERDSVAPGKKLAQILGADSAFGGECFRVKLFGEGVVLLNIFKRGSDKLMIPCAVTA